MALTGRFPSHPTTLEWKPPTEEPEPPNPAEIPPGPPEGPSRGPEEFPAEPTEVPAEPPRANFRKRYRCFEPGYVKVPVSRRLSLSAIHSRANDSAGRGLPNISQPEPKHTRHRAAIGAGDSGASNTCYSTNSAYRPNC